MSTLKVNEITNLDDETRFGPTLSTAVATTSGTTITFSDIPSWATEIIVRFYAVSGSGTNQMLVQLTDTTGLLTSGYVSGGMVNVSKIGSTAGFIFYTNQAGVAVSGTLKLHKVEDGKWCGDFTGLIVASDFTGHGGGYVPTTGAVSAVTLAWTGADTFDGGTCAISYQ